MFYFVPNTTTTRIYFDVTLFIGGGHPYIVVEMALSSKVLPCDVMITVGIKDKSIYNGTIIYCNVVFSAGEIGSSKNTVTGINHGNVELSTAISEPSGYKDSNGNTYVFSVTTNTQP